MFKHTSRSLPHLLVEPSQHNALNGTRVEDVLVGCSEESTETDELLSLELGMDELAASQLHEDSRLMEDAQLEWDVIKKRLFVCDVQVSSPNWYRLTRCLESCPILEGYYAHRTQLWDLTLQVYDL